MLAAAQQARVPDRDLLHMKEEMTMRSGKVRLGNSVSREYTVEDGAEQGRRRSPPLYCALVRKLAEAALQASVGVGGAIGSSHVRNRLNSLRSVDW